MINKSLMQVVTAAQELLRAGVYDQHELFDILFPRFKKHYSTVRRGIHIAKTGIFRYD
jgi:hypothetical protein